MVAHLAMDHLIPETQRIYLQNSLGVALLDLDRLDPGGHRDSSLMKEYLVDWMQVTIFFNDIVKAGIYHKSHHYGDQTALQLGGVVLWIDSENEDLKEIDGGQWPQTAHLGNKDVKHRCKARVEEGNQYYIPR